MKKREKKIIPSTHTSFFSSPSNVVKINDLTKKSRLLRSSERNYCYSQTVCTTTFNLRVCTCTNKVRVLLEHSNHDNYGSIVSTLLGSKYIRFTKQGFSVLIGYLPQF